MEQQPQFDLDKFDVEVIPHEVSTNERSLARRIALQVLYEVDSVEHAADEVMQRRLTAQNAERKVVQYVRKLIQSAVEHRKQLDALIQQYAPEWPLDQVAIVDRNILRIAILEFAVLHTVPVGVAIDQAVELAKLFGADSAPRFVNGVLGTLAEKEEDVLRFFKPDAENNSE